MNATKKYYVATIKVIVEADGHGQANDRLLEALQPIAVDFGYERRTPNGPRQFVHLADTAAVEELIELKKADKAATEAFNNSYGPEERVYELETESIMAQSEYEEAFDAII